MSKPLSRNMQGVISRLKEYSPTVGTPHPGLIHLGFLFESEEGRAEVLDYLLSNAASPHWETAHFAWEVAELIQGLPYDDEEWFEWAPDFVESLLASEDTTLQHRALDIIAAWADPLFVKVLQDALEHEHSFGVTMAMQQTLENLKATNSVREAL